MRKNPVVGEQAPYFSAETKEGIITNKSLRGHLTVLYFYPKDDTPGCTKEACQFRDSIELFRELNADVIGVSPDKETSHINFQKKHGLNFILLPDPTHRICIDFGVWEPKEMFGKKILGVTRTTFVIDYKGMIRWIEKPVIVEGHHERVLEVIKSLQGELEYD